MAQEPVELVARDIGAARVVRTGIAKDLIAAHRRFRRAPADAKRQPAIGQNIQRRGLFGQIKRVFIAQVDNAGADLDPLGPGGDGGHQRHRGGLLPGKMVDAKIGAVHAQFLGADTDIDRLSDHVAGSAGLRPVRIRIMAKAQKAESTHLSLLPRKRPDCGTGVIPGRARRGAARARGSPKERCSARFLEGRPGRTRRSSGSNVGRPQCPSGFNPEFRPLRRGLRRRSGRPRPGSGRAAGPGR